MNNNKSVILVALVLLITLSASQSTWGKEVAIGKINKIMQPVTVVKSNGQETKGREELSLFAGDRIITGKQGQADFSFHSGSQFWLGKDAEVSIDELYDAEDKKDQPVLMLALGYLRSKIQGMKGKDNKTVLHTPTTVIGVRGTEFDTVVSLDATTTVAVDEGSVEVGSETEKTVVDKEKMVTSDPYQKLFSHMRAIPRKKRDWQAWRKHKADRLLKTLPKRIPKYRMRFERAVSRLTRATSKLDKGLARVRHGMKTARQARTDGDRKKFVRTVRQLKKQAVLFRSVAANFRRGLNHVRVKSKFAHHVRKYISHNKERFSRDELDIIQSELDIISRKTEDLGRVSGEAINNIKKTFKELAEYKARS